GYGMQQMNNFNQAMQASMGQGMAAAVGGNNLFASNRMIKAFAWGAGVGASSALAATTGDAGSNPDYRNNFDKKQYGSYKDALADAQKRESEGRMRPQDRNLLRSARNQRGKNIRGGIDKFARDTLNTAFSILSADAKLDAVNGYLHDKRFGRWSGSITSNYEATAAALDGSGGFELMMERDAGIGELVDNFMAQVRAGKKILDNLGQAGGNLLANLLEERDARRGQKKKEEQEQEEQEQAADRQAEARKGKGGPRGVPKGDEAEANARGYAGRKRREGGTAEEVISDAVDEVIEEGGSKIIELFKKGLASTAAGADRYGAYAPGLVNFIMAVTADGEDPNDRFGKKDDAFYGYFGHSRAAKSWSWENTE
ncbi:MAG: hypothetical protein KDD44_13610, partial [Bdellovibrionales bacterium]|nr:hypothetical protein [Bdellovibrionales bacterium]